MFRETPRLIMMVPELTIITTDLNEVTVEVHHRMMPVILAPKHYERWLTREDTERHPSICDARFRPSP
jgi:putative SOS response-associated peptidase YedK